MNDELLKQIILSGLSTDSIKLILDKIEEDKKNTAIKMFNAAMAIFQGECPIIPKREAVMNKDGVTKRYSFAPIEKIVEAVKPFISKNGFSYTTTTEISNGTMTSVVLVSHVDGYSRVSRFTVPIEKDAYMNDQQKWAAAQTFSMRYAFRNAFGILTGDEDDDANSLTQKENEEEKKAAFKKEQKKIQDLPTSVKEAFKALGYTSQAVWSYCNMHEWNNEKILEGLNAIANKRDAK